MIIKHTSAHEVVMLINVDEVIEDKAQKLISKNADEFVDNCESSGYELALCNVINENGESISCASEVFVLCPP